MADTKKDIAILALILVVAVIVGNFLSAALVQPVADKYVGRLKV